MAIEHEFDALTMFCRRCGVSRHDVENGRRAIVCEAEAAVAISHRVAGAALREAARKILGGAP